MLDSSVFGMPCSCWICHALLIMLKASSSQDRCIRNFLNWLGLKSSISVGFGFDCTIRKGIYDSQVIPDRKRVMHLASVIISLQKEHKRKDEPVGTLEATLERRRITTESTAIPLALSIRE